MYISRALFPPFTILAIFVIAQPKQEELPDEVVRCVGFGEDTYSQEAASHTGPKPLYEAQDGLQIQVPNIRKPLLFPSTLCIPAHIRPTLIQTAVPLHTTLLGP